ncbi:hypothetical protein [Acetobacter persici]|uniref:hypothetical protein n=1 Tax=Acetobacter persici TaxID=1076596 RepID=UPI0039E72BC3
MNHIAPSLSPLDSEFSGIALGKVERGIAGIMAAIEDGMYQSSMKARLVSLEGQKADIVARLGEAPPDVPNVHPDIASHYRRNVERFTEALDDRTVARKQPKLYAPLSEELFAP